MGKLKLEIDALRVESFETAGVRADTGTVRAHVHGDAMEEAFAITTPQTQGPSCFATCKITCQGSCFGTCIGTCEAKCSDLCSLGCSDGCTAYTCLSGGPVCCA